MPSLSPAAHPPRRRYDMRARAAAARARHDRIVDAATALFLAASYDEVSLQAVAARAGVSLKTVLRRFGSKDALVVACGRRECTENAVRAVAPGDVRGVVRVLAARYEEEADAVVRYLALEGRIPAVRSALTAGRRRHARWLAAAFAPWLPRRGAVRARRLAALFGATEIYVWWSWRRHMGQGRGAAEAAMLEQLEALVARWAPDGGSR